VPPNVRWNAWFGVNGSLHAEIVERNTSKLDHVWFDQKKTDLLKTRTGRNAHIGCKTRDAATLCPHENPLKQQPRDPLALKLRMNVQKIEIPAVLNSGDTRNLILALTNESGSVRETL
jgi:hypothetical protein